MIIIVSDIDGLSKQINLSRSNGSIDPMQLSLIF